MPRKTKKSGSPPKPTRTMPRRGRKQVQFEDDIQAEELSSVIDIKENVEPEMNNDGSVPKEALKRTRRNRKAVEKQSVLEPTILCGGDLSTSPNGGASAPTFVEDAASEADIVGVLPQKRSRRGKRSKDDAIGAEKSSCEIVGTVFESSGSAPEEVPASQVGTKRSRRGKRSKEEPAIVQSITREGTFTKSPVTSAADDVVEGDVDSAPKRGSKGRSGRSKRTKEELSVEPGATDEIPPIESRERTSKETSADMPSNASDKASEEENEAVRPGFVREGTFTKSPNTNDTLSPKAKSDLSSSFTVVAAPNESGNTFSSTPTRICETTSAGMGAVVSPATQRRATFTKTPIRPRPEAEVIDSPVSQRRATFTKTPRRSSRSALVFQEQENASPRIQREGTFTKSEENEPVPDSSSQNDDAPELKREGTFTKKSAKQNSGSSAGDIPDFKANLERTPDPIGNMSVFQRLSARISLSERRSLISEKRTSLRNKFLTPQQEKGARLSAIRHARQNHLSLKSITFERGTTPTSPALTASTKKPKSAVKKPPNFAAIHERNFAKMESLMENRKRLRERATFLMSPLRPTQASGIPKFVKKAVAPSRKAAPIDKSKIPVMKMATKEVLKAAVANKRPTGPLLKTQTSKVLKGVRTNKRFELLLNQRNMKI